MAQDKKPNQTIATHLSVLKNLEERYSSEIDAQEELRKPGAVHIDQAVDSATNWLEIHATSYTDAALAGRKEMLDYLAALQSSIETNERKISDIPRLIVTAIARADKVYEENRKSPPQERGDHTSRLLKDAEYRNSTAYLK